jgi:hypothetical protein
MVRVAQPEHVLHVPDEPRLLRVATTAFDHIFALNGSPRSTRSQMMRI